MDKAKQILSKDEQGNYFAILINQKTFSSHSTKTYTKRALALHHARKMAANLGWTVVETSDRTGE